VELCLGRRGDEEEALVQRMLTRGAVETPAAVAAARSRQRRAGAEAEAKRLSEAHAARMEEAHSRDIDSEFTECTRSTPLPS
jgi:hypothetical protein